MNKTAVVNSKSFGKYFPEHIEKLNTLGGVDILDIDIHFSSEEIAEQLAQYEYIIASVTPDFDRDFFEKSPNLKLIARHGLGYNNVDIDAATEHGVYVTKVEGIVEREAVAEHTVALLSSLARWIPQANNSLRTQPWSSRSKYGGVELNNSVVGIVGFGNIGSRVGEILNKGYGSEVLVYDPYKNEDYIKRYGGIKVSLDELLERANLITINASANEKNIKMLSKDQFKKMREGVLIVNTARGILLDEVELILALETGKVAGYAADVFNSEPIEDDNRLKSFDNVILTPHIGAYTYPSLKGMGDNVVGNVEKVQKGMLPKEIVNEGVVPK